MRCWNWSTKRFSQIVRQGCYKGGCCKIAPTKKWDRLPPKGLPISFFVVSWNCNEPTTTWTVSQSWSIGISLFRPSENIFDADRKLCGRTLADSRTPAKRIPPRNLSAWFASSWRTKNTGRTCCAESGASCLSVNVLSLGGYVRRILLQETASIVVRPVHCFHLVAGVK